MSRSYKTLDRIFVGEMHRWGVPLLRVALGIVFLWFGALKVFDVTPVTSLVAAAYSFVPTAKFIFVLGVWEVLIGAGLLFKKALRTTLALLWLQMAGALFALILSPATFFSGGNLFLPTIEGEFVIKNVVLIAASLVVGGYEVKR